MTKNYAEVVVIDNKIYDTRKIENAEVYQNLKNKLSFEAAMEAKNEQIKKSKLEEEAKAKAISLRYANYYSAKNLLLILNYLLTAIDLNIVDDDDLFSEITDILKDLHYESNVEAILNKHQKIKEYFVKYLGEY